MIEVFFRVKNVFLRRLWDKTCYFMFFGLKRWFLIIFSHFGDIIAKPLCMFLLLLSVGLSFVFICFHLLFIIFFTYLNWFTRFIKNISGENAHSIMLTFHQSSSKMLMCSGSQINTISIGSSKKILESEVYTEMRNEDKKRRDVYSVREQKYWFFSFDWKSWTSMTSYSNHEESVILI